MRGRTPQNRSKGPQLRSVDDADCIREHEMAASIGIEKDEPGGLVAGWFDQGENRFPNLRDFPPSPCRTALCQFAQQFRALALPQIIPQRGCQSARGTIDQMNALALNFVQSKNDAKLSERPTRAPGQVDESWVGAITTFTSWLPGTR